MPVMKSEKVKPEHLQLIRTAYIRQRRGVDDKIILFFRDLDTGEKVHKVVKDPEIEYYVSREALARPVNYVSLNEVDKVVSRYRELASDLAYMTGEEDFFNECISARRFGALKRLQLDASLHGTDVHIEDYYIGRALDKYPPKKGYKPTKGYYDIEVDIEGFEGFPDPSRAPCPVNIITYLNSETMVARIFMLEDPGNASQAEFLGHLRGEAAGIAVAVLERTKLAVFVEVTVLGTELELIRAFFAAANEDKLDFMCAKQTWLTQ